MHRDKRGRLLCAEFNDQLAPVGFGQDQFGHNDLIAVFSNPPQGFFAVVSEIALEPHLFESELETHLGVRFVVDDQRSREWKLHHGSIPKMIRPEPGQARGASRLEGEIQVTFEFKA